MYIINQLSRNEKQANYCNISWNIPIFLQAQNDTIEGVNKPLGLSLEDLMNIKVVSASGYMETTAEAPSTIQVITAKQITEEGMNANLFN